MQACQQNSIRLEYEEAISAGLAYFVVALYTKEDERYLSNLIHENL